MRLMTLLLLATVMITINQPAQPIECPPSEPSIVKNDDGTYSRTAMNTVNLVACWTNYQAWVEEWTDYPENGGTFIKQINTGKDVK